MPEPAKPKPMRKKSSGDAANRAIISIDRPLGFFVQTLLIVETYFGAVQIFSKATDDHRYREMLLGAGLFSLVVILVWTLVLFRPHALMYDRDAHLIDRQRADFGTEKSTAGKAKKLPPSDRPDPPTQNGKGKYCESMR